MSKGRARIEAERRAAENPIVRTFDEVFGDHRLKPHEREALVFRLAAIRAEKTIRALLPIPAHPKEHASD